MAIELVVDTHDPENLYLIQYKDSPAFKAFIKAFLDPLMYSFSSPDSLENQYQLFISSRSLQTANGELLRAWMDLLDTYVTYIDDDDLRRKLWIRVSELFSNGSIYDVRDFFQNYFQAYSVNIIELGEGRIDIDVYSGTIPPAGTSDAFKVFPAGLAVINEIRFLDENLVFSFASDQRPFSLGFGIVNRFSNSYTTYVFPTGAAGEIIIPYLGVNQPSAYEIQGNGLDFALAGQLFLGNDKSITSITFRLGRVAAVSLSGELCAVLYLGDKTGENLFNKPSALLISNNLSPVIGIGDILDVKFTFPSSYLLTAGQVYTIALHDNGSTVNGYKMILNSSTGYSLPALYKAFFGGLQPEIYAANFSIGFVNSDRITLDYNQAGTVLNVSLVFTTTNAAAASLVSSLDDEVFDIYDRLGTQWSFRGTGTGIPGGTVTTAANGDFTDVKVRLCYNNTPIIKPSVNGIYVRYQDMNFGGAGFPAFAGYLNTDESTYNTKNPNGISLGFLEIERANIGGRLSVNI
jgi:hypothetical protein